MLLGSLNRVKHRLKDYAIISENIEEDLKAKIYMNKLLFELEKFKVPKEIEEFLKVAEPYRP